MSKITKETPESEKAAPNTALSSIFGKKIESDDSLRKGLANLNRLPPFDAPPPAVHGKKFSPGIMAFRKTGAGKLSITVACGTAQARHIPLAKYVAMVEKLNDPESSTILLQNFQDQDDHRSGRGQELGRINAKSSAIVILQGLTGRIVRSMDDIALHDVYYLDRRDMATFYLAAKAQIGNADQMETMLTAYEGWKAFEVPLDHLSLPHGL